MATRRRRKPNGQFAAGSGSKRPRRKARGVGPARKCIGRDARGRILKGFVLTKGGVRRKRPSKPRVRVTTSGRVRDAAGQLSLFN
jgi:hypothetical protein